MRRCSCRDTRCSKHGVLSTTRFPISRERAMPAATTWVTGREQTTWEWEQVLCPLGGGNVCPSHVISSTGLQAIPKKGIETLNSSTGRLYGRKTSCYPCAQREASTSQVWTEMVEIFSWKTSRTFKPWLMRDWRAYGMKRARPFWHLPPRACWPPTISWQGSFEFSMDSE